ncbi:hypothetical protein [Deinococcus roseus]|uniref:Uncharacterized protein n=1 Tax=Deinococcus roseus TaxID=392414 RepID=A0ABQ2DFN5_9DEIO|nr:hypothetical protein [Deinococcus roseus]GGJ54756.1 hypothetical protein GCM10008938_46020 [Deinococcus roseus]
MTGDFQGWVDPTSSLPSLHTHITLHQIPEPWHQTLWRFWERTSLHPVQHPVDIEMGEAQGKGSPVTLNWIRGQVTGLREGGANQQMAGNAAQ